MGSGKPVGKGHSWVNHWPCTSNPYVGTVRWQCEAAHNSQGQASRRSQDAATRLQPEQSLHWHDDTNGIGCSVHSSWCGRPIWAQWDKAPIWAHFWAESPAGQRAEGPIWPAFQTSAGAAIASASSTVTPQGGPALVFQMRGEAVATQNRHAGEPPSRGRLRAPLEHVPAHPSRSVGYTFVGYHVCRIARLGARWHLADT